MKLHIDKEADALYLRLDWYMRHFFWNIAEIKTPTVGWRNQLGQEFDYYGAMKLHVDALHATAELKCEGV